MKQKKIYYKLVNRGASLYDTDASVSYSVDTWTKPRIKGSKFFVYPSKAVAMSSGEAYRTGTVLYECEVKHARPAYNFRQDISHNMQLYWDLVNKARKQKKSINKCLYKAWFNQNVSIFDTKTVYLYEMPPNVVFCSEVKLLKAV